MISDPDSKIPGRDKNGARTEPGGGGDLEGAIHDLFSDRYEVRVSAVAALAKLGEKAAGPMIEVLLRRRAEPHALSNFSDALAEIGKPALPAIVAGLDRISELKRPVDVYLLETLADVLGMLEDRRALGSLGRQIERLHESSRTNPDPLVRECCEAARIRLRRVLFDLGDRGGADELLSILGDGRKRLPSDLVGLLAKIGNKHALVPLARLHIIEENVSFSGAQFIREAIREIAQRERLRPEDPILVNAEPAERALLERILPRGKFTTRT
jgi:HEAT repeat protein